MERSFVILLKGFRLCLSGKHTLDHAKSITIERRRRRWREGGGSEVRGVR